MVVDECQRKIELGRFVHVHLFVFVCLCFANDVTIIDRDEEGDERCETICTKTFFFSENEMMKIVAHNTQKCSLRRATNDACSKICG